MSHTSRERKKLLARVHRIRGQVDAIERALDEEAGCERVIHMIAGIRGAVTGLMAEVFEDHIRLHLMDSENSAELAKREAAEQLIEAMHSYLK